jgi:hypothetical protein
MAKWRKGQSGNPKGAPTHHEVLQKYLGAAHYCRPLVPKMVKVLERVANAKRGSAASKVSAATRVIDFAEPTPESPGVNLSQGKGGKWIVTVNIGKKKSRET